MKKKHSRWVYIQDKNRLLQVGSHQAGWIVWEVDTSFTFFGPVRTKRACVEFLNNLPEAQENIAMEKDTKDNQVGPADTPRVEEVPSPLIPNVIAFDMRIGDQGCFVHFELKPEEAAALINYLSGQLALKATVRPVPQDLKPTEAENAQPN